MNLNNILLVYNTRKILPKAPVVENLFGMKLGGEGIIITAKGNPVSIVTNRAQNAISTILSYSPKQSGTGDPSPSNVRPIEGWTEANLHVNEATITESLGGTYYGFSIDVERGGLANKRSLLVFNGTENWNSLFDGDNRYFFVSRGTTKLYEDDIESNLNSVCSHFITADIRSSNTVVGARSFYSSALYQQRIIFRPPNVASMNEYDWKAYLADQYSNGTPVQFCPKLATPAELPLTPQTVALLAGNNTIWTDGDSVTITYRR